MPEHHLKPGRNWYSIVCAAVVAALLAAAYSALWQASLGRYSTRAALLAALLAAAGTILVSRRWRTAGRSVADLTAGAVVLSIACGSLLLTLPPSEMLLGGWDPGVYLHTAAAIAKGKSLWIAAPDIYALPEAVSRDLTRLYAGWKHPFPGIFPWPEGHLLPQFMHLYPALMAVGYGVAGIWGALLVNPLLNICAIVAIYWLAARVVGRWWGVLAALLLALNPAQIWQATFSTSELLAQVVLLVSLVAAIEFCKAGPTAGWGALTGVLFGLAFLVRYDAILTLVPLIPLLLLTKSAAAEAAQPGCGVDRKSSQAFGMALLLLGLHGWLYLTRVAPCYRPLPGLVFPLLRLALFLSLLLLLALQFKAVQRLVARMVQRDKWWRLALLLVWLALLLFVAYLRPRLTVEGRVAALTGRLLAGRAPQGVYDFLAGPEALNIRYLTAIFGHWGVALAAAGVALLIWTTRVPGVLAWLTAAILTTAVLLTDSFCDHFMMWMSRRFVPVVIPLFTIGIVVAVRGLYQALAAMRRRYLPLLALLLLLPHFVYLLPRSRIVATTRDWPGLTVWYDELSSHIPADALLFSDQSGFAAPLRFIYGFEAYEIYGKQSCAAFALKHHDFLAATGRPALFLSAGPAVTEATSQLALPLTSSTLDRRPHTIPGSLRKRGGAFVLYRVDYQLEPSGASDAGAP